MSKYSKFANHLSFIDMLFALLIGVFSIFIISTMLLGEPKSKAKIDEQASLMIDMTWDDMSADDMDLWVKGPSDGSDNQDPVGYSHRENAYMSLDRDDLGIENDHYTVNGVSKLIRHNEEITRVRKLVPGHYVVNVMFYSRHPDPETKTFSHGPQPVKVKLLEINPNYSVLMEQTVMVDEHQQATAFSFDVLEDGSVVNFSTVQDPFLNMMGHAPHEEGE